MGRSQEPVSSREGVGPVIPCGCGCGGILTQFDANGRERRYLHGHNVVVLWRRLRELQDRTKSVDTPADPAVPIVTMR